jgi:hypothetical protein
MGHRQERAHTWEGATYPVIYFDLFDGELLWGLSARITVDLLDALAAE